MLRLVMVKVVISKRVTIQISTFKEIIEHIDVAVVDAATAAVVVLWRLMMILRQRRDATAAALGCERMIAVVVVVDHNDILVSSGRNFQRAGHHLPFGSRRDRSFGRHE